MLANKILAKNKGFRKKYEKISFCILKVTKSQKKGVRSGSADLDLLVRSKDPHQNVTGP